MNIQERDTIKIYSGLLKNYEPLYFLESIFTKEEARTHLWNAFQGVHNDAPLDFLEIVKNPVEADFFLLPYNFFSLKESLDAEAHALIFSLGELAKKYQKKILVFCMDDSDEHVEIPNAVIFRYSQYGYKKRKNEVITPPYPLHDRSPGLEEYRKIAWGAVSLREKGEKPTVSFCGWAGFPSLYRFFTYQTRILFADIRKYILKDQHAELHKRGIYFRRKAVRVLRGASHVQTDFLLRKAYSAQRGFDDKKPIFYEDAEREHIESIINSDFVLAPKGNGNASVRFYEALSLGRFPVLINTDCVLPLKNHIDYSKFVVSVDHTRIHDAERTILDFYNSLSAEEFQRRQQLARKAFELLRPGSFLKIVLSELKKKEEGYK